METWVAWGGQEPLIVPWACSDGLCNASYCPNYSGATAAFGTLCSLKNLQEELSSQQEAQRKDQQERQAGNAAEGVASSSLNPKTKAASR